MFASGDGLRTGRDLTDHLRARLSTVLTRFAPAPTGALHLGHVVNAIYVWGLARALGGRVLLRIEDHDRQRARPEFERALLDDLDWLGFEADLYPAGAYRMGRCDGRQSERDAIYRAALAPLAAAGLVYGCRCSRADQAGDRYVGTCRARNIPLDDGVGWRLKLDPGIEAFDDGLLGPQEQDPSAQCGDLLIRDRLGNWTYQFVAAVDDTVQGMTLVVRGHDLLPSTGRQIRVARMIGRAAPAVFAHHPLIMKTATQKLSKSDGDSGVADLRGAGWSADDVIARARELSGIESFE
ncbi:MAG TPA: glutamate--tRNA ligase family protein [Vicinamibacterales bacterium]|jgi:glutamyl-tRNA synthetase/glutamyl-Q tRNA(Asp) synthetase